jgi:putative lipoprotein
MLRFRFFLVATLALLAPGSLSWGYGAPQVASMGSNAPAGQSAITGSVTYRERMALPPDAAIAVKLQEVAPGGDVKTIAETLFAPAGKQVPVAFQLTYNPADIHAGHTYQVTANISAKGRPMFATVAPYTITPGTHAQVTLVLQPAAPVAPTAAGAAKLRATMWVLAEVNGTPALPGEGKAAHFILHKKGSLTGSTGCNNLAGTYIASEGALQFTPGAMTMKACTPAVSQQEQAFLGALKATTKYKIDGGTLELLNGEKVLAKFQAEAKQ